VLGGILPAALFFLFLAAMGIVHVTGRVLVVETGYRLSRLQAEGRELEREHHRLMLERATLTNPQRLEELARSELSMAPPSPSDIHSVSAPPEGAMAAVPGTQRGPQ
jgi:cell division protein FtsL